jgi:hypothetical protein
LENTMKKNGSRKQRTQPPDAYTPPGGKPTSLPNAARYLITEYDKPLDPLGDDHTEFLVALYQAAKMLRREAMKWRDHIDWGGTAGDSESDMEERFGRANACDREAKLLLDEYRRGARREWIATFPRNGPQYSPEAQRLMACSSRNMDRFVARKRGKAVRS